MCYCVLSICIDLQHALLTCDRGMILKSLSFSFDDIFSSSSAVMTLPLITTSFMNTSRGYEVADPSRVSKIS